MKFNIEIELNQDEFETLKNLYEIQKLFDFSYAVSTNKFVSNIFEYGSILNNLKSKELITIHKSPNEFGLLDLGAEIYNSYSRLTKFGIMLVGKNK